MKIMEYIMWVVMAINMICIGAMVLCGVTLSMALAWLVTLFVVVFIIAAGVYEEDKSLD